MRGSLKDLLSVSGKTQEGKSVLRGVFEVTSSIGLPLVSILVLLEENGCLVDWIDYYESALKQGMQTDRILSRIEGDISDVYGADYRNEVLKRLRFYIGNK